MVRHSVAAMVLVFVGLCSGRADPEGDAPDCPDLDFQVELRQNINPAALLEDGRYVFIDNKPVSRDCLRKRVCQVNEFTRKRFNQSYYISLKEPGGVEIERQFPEIVKIVAEGRGDTRVIYLNNFCRHFETARAGRE